MREIKFRIRNKNNDRFDYYTLEELIFSYGLSDADDWKNATQFTGLKDKNGREIYEGDIIECEYYPNLPTTKNLKSLIWHGIVEYAMDASFHVYKIPDRMSHAVNYSGSAIKRWEVIGNIYENPELLRG